MSSKIAPWEFKMDLVAYQRWLEEGGETNHEDINRLKRIIRQAVVELLTEKQQQCFTMYFIDMMTMDEIGKLFGTDKSCVSRMIARSKKRLRQVLKYALPQTASVNWDTFKIRRKYNRSRAVNGGSKP